ncbi:MAG TPA: hypothetical protein K8V13_11940 [Enterobacter roggenkampii]|nr:hypothetical protein [Enterobacter roggenkampii]
MSNKTISTVKVNLENADSALKQIQSLNSGVENVTVNMQKLNQAFKDAPQTINEFLKQIDKVNNKGHLQGSVTSRDKQALDVRTSDLSDLLKDITSVIGTNNITDSSTGRTLDNSELKQLNSNAERIISLLSNAGINANATLKNGTINSIGVDPTDAFRTAYNQTVRDTKNRGTSVSTGFEKSVSDAIDKAISNIRSSNGVLSNNRRTMSDIRTSTNSGQVSYARDKQYQGFYKNADDTLASSAQKLSGSKDSLKDIRRSLDSAISTKQDAINSNDSSEDIAKYEKELQKLNSLKDKVNLQIDKLTNAQSKVKEGQSSLNSSKISYNNAKRTGDLNVDVDPDSFRGKLKRHSMGITALTGSVATGALVGGTMQGTNIRKSAYDMGTGSIMLGLANQGITGRKMDDKVLNTLTNTGIHNGTNYSGQEMVQFANAYTSSNRTGNIKDYNKQADSISKMARFSGMSNDSASGLIQSAGFSGVTNFTDFSKVVSGAIQGSGMAGRGTEMANALSTMLSNSANVGNMTQTEASRMAAFQGIMNSTHNSAIQGQQGAQAFNGMVNGLTNTSSGMSRFLFAQSSGYAAKYGNGPEGQFRLSMEMEDARQDPTKLSPVLDQLNKNVGGNKYLMAQELEQLSGGQLSAHQALAMTELYKKGDFTKKNVDKVMKEDKEKGGDSKSNKGKKAYSSSGKSTLDFSIAIDDKGNVQISQATDSIRGLKAGIKNVTGVAGGVLFDAAAQFGGSMLSSWISSKFSKHVSGKLGKGKGGSSRGLRTEGIKSSKGSKGVLGKILDFGKNIGSGIIQDFAFDKITGGIGKLFGKGKGLLGKVLGKGKGSGLLKGLFEGGKDLLGKGKGLLKVAKFGKLAGTAGVVALGIHDIKEGNKLLSSNKKKVENSKHDGLLTGLVRKTLGDKAANGLQDFVWGTHKKSSSKSSKKKKKTTKKQETYISKQKKLLRQFNAMLDKAEKVIALAKSGGDSSGDDSKAGNVSGGDHVGDASYWEGKIKEVAKAMGQEVSDEQVKMISSMMKAESGYNEKVDQQIHDINTEKGTPAKGILQFIQPTFDKYKVSGHDNIYSGIDQLYALFNDSNWKSDIHYGGGWGPTGTPIKHASGGLFSKATMLGNKDVVGEDGLEAVIPLNGKHYSDGKNVIKSLAGAFGSTLVDNNDLNRISTRKSVNLNPNYNLSVNLSGDENPQAVKETVLNQLQSTTQSMQDKLLNYYSMDIHNA